MDRHQAVRPVWPVVSVVFHEPQHAALVAVGRTAAYLAEEFAHCPLLPLGVDVAKLRYPLAPFECAPCPQRAGAIAIVCGFVRVSDSLSTLDECRPEAVLGSP